MLNPLRCVVIDDENPAVQLLVQYILKTPGLELLLATTKSIAGLEIIQSANVDLIFLDIQMPELSGLEIMQIIGQNEAKVILTTAYEQYALTGYDYNVIDYLLKPITFERFSHAIAKARQRHHGLPNSKLSPPEFIFIKTEYLIKKIEIVSILYIEALGDYITIHLIDEKILSLERMKNLEKVLPVGDFIRIHKSYIINIRHIDYLERRRVVINNTHLPIGDTYKDLVKARLGF